MSAPAGDELQATFLSMTNNLGEKITRLLSGAHEQIVIISAFVRGDALSRILSDANSKVPVTVFARWRLADLVCGASDLAAFDIARERGAKFRIHSALHAKAFIADNSALVGSANVTLSAFGESENPNTEILVPTPADDPCIQSLLKSLFTESMIVDENYVSLLRNVIQENSGIVDETKNPPLSPESDNWLPATQIPQDFLDFLSFRRESMERLRDDTKALAMRDCCALGLSVGADRYENIAQAIIQCRLFQELRDQILSSDASGLSDEMAAKFLVESFHIPQSKAGGQWMIVKAWLRAFLQKEFIVVPLGGEEVRIGEKIRRD